MSDPVVEELLEKGARAVSPHAWDDDNGWTTDTYADVQNNARAIAGRVLDAVFPGWREGITRELSARHDKNRYYVGDSYNARHSVEVCSVCVLESRLALFGPWVPVEEGTDG